MHPKRQALRLAACAMVIAPIFAIIPETLDVGVGQLPYTLYREPKLTASLIFGWIFIALSSWTHVPNPSWSEARSIIRVRGWWPLLGLVGISTLSLSWAPVRAIGLYEVQQYVSYTVLTACVALWARRDKIAPRILIMALALSMGVVTLIGLLQLAREEPFELLLPARAYTGTVHGSFFGLKNPAGAAIGGQLFLVGALAHRAAQQGRRAFAIGWTCLALVELAYIGTLNSRSAVLALAIGGIATVGLVVLRLVQTGHRSGTVLTLCSVLLVSGVVGTPIARDSEMRTRWLEATDLVRSPDRISRSDRGTYAMNSINMALENPLGVGIGNWQAMYPIYRNHNRYLGFNDMVQVRRAHNDHLQMLAEAGAAGFFLWVWLQGSILGALATAWLRKGDYLALFLSGQLLAYNLLMLTDHTLEQPFGKFHYFLLLALTLSHLDSTRSRDQAEPIVKYGRHSRIGPTVLTVTGIAIAFFAASSLQRHRHLKRIDAAFTIQDRVLPRLSTSLPVTQASRRCQTEIVDHWRAAAALPGSSKIEHSAAIIAAYTMIATGRVGEAELAIQRAFELHPYGPSVFKASSAQHAAAGNFDNAAIQTRLSEYIMHDATVGFDPPFAWELSE